jgi:hypothetical protein
MNPKLCKVCGRPIPEERLAVLPGTVVCVKCSTEKPRKGVMVWSQKTAPELVTLDADSEALRISKLRTWH